MSEASRTIQRAVLGLGLFACLTAGLIGVTWLISEEPISRARAQAQTEALQAVLPGVADTSGLLDEAFLLEETTGLGFTTPVTAYRVVQDGGVIAVVLPWRSDEGYAGPIYGIAGIAADGTVLGVRVTEHHETPGLGDKVERRKSDWITDFEGRRLGAPPLDAWTVRKAGGEFDAFTGATITPRAVIAAVANTLLYFDQHRTGLLRDGLSEKKP